MLFFIMLPSALSSVFFFRFFPPTGSFTGVSTTVKTEIVENAAKRLEMPLLVRSVVFFLFLCLK